MNRQEEYFEEAKRAICEAEKTPVRMQEQITKFKEGIRGSHPKDIDGAKMAPIIRNVLPAIAQQQGVSADEAVKDVLTYIYLNREK